MTHPQRVTVTIPVKSGIPADSVVWSMFFDRGTAPSSTDYDNWKANFQDFIRTVGAGQSFALQSFLSPTISQASNSWIIRFYDIPAARTTLGSPVASRTTNSTSAGAQPCPEELACALSYQRGYGSDVEFGPSHTRPRASDRGRFYVGPLSRATIDWDATTFATQLEASFRDTLTTAAKNYLHDEMLTDSWIWIQFSHKLWDWDAVTSIWADNAFDVQRRRGRKATVKTALAV